MSIACSRRRRRRGLRLGALLSLAVLGCLPPSPSTGVERPSRTTTEISRAEIEAEVARFSTAYDLVHTLRPSMLVRRSGAQSTESRLSLPGSTRGIKVYLDGLAFGGVEKLTLVPASSVIHVQWLSALDATTRYGTGNPDGAILVTTRSGR